jgi:lysine 2,3-aminomutase
MWPRDHLDKWFKGQGLWSDVDKSEWSDYHWQLRNRYLTVEHLKKDIKLTQEEEEGCLSANQKLYIAITPYYFNLIDREDPDCPIRKQVIPRKAEQIIAPEELLDPVGEENTMPINGLVHRYPDRVLFLVTSYCAAYCRYCTRSRLVSNAQEYDFHPDYESAIKYIEEHTEIRDVLISGGDPLLLPDRKLAMLLSRLRAIPHVEFVRIGTRIPVFMPQRITPELCAILKENGPIWMSIHVNHPKECTQELSEACEKLACSRVVLGNQSVLLKGVNDDVEIMKSLSHRLLQMGVRPYYIYQCDLITGSSHFRTDPRKGLEIIENMRGHTTGYAVPQFVIDAPGGGGKIPINPTYIKEINDNSIILRNYKQNEYVYPFNPIRSPAVESKLKTTKTPAFTGCQG